MNDISYKVEVACVGRKKIFKSVHIRIPELIDLIKNGYVSANDARRNSDWLQRWGYKMLYGKDKFIWTQRLEIDKNNNEIIIKLGNCKPDNVDRLMSKAQKKKQEEINVRTI